MIKKLVNPILFFILTVLLSSYTGIFCKREGIKGNIYRVSGNRMPSPGEPRPAPRPLSTTLYIYELTNISQVKKAEKGSFYTTVSTRLIKEVKADKKGRFKVKLPPGQYSLFIKKDALFYANIFDDKNNLYPVTVEKGKYAAVDVKADYDAVY
jgi:hypothetical protein